MGLHDPFGHLKHRLWPKERPRVKLAIWFFTIESQKLTQFPCVQVVCDIPLNFLDEGYNCTLNLILIRGLHVKLWAPKIAKVPIVGVLGLALRSPRTKWHLGAGSMARHIIYYKREGGGLPPKSGPWWVLWIYVCSWFIHAPKCSNYALTNLWFGLCKFV